MSLPNAQKVLKVIGVTWPAAKTYAEGPFTIRRGDGGGSRVSAATANSSATTEDILSAAASMTALRQTPLFMIRQQDTALDKQLAGLGYAIKDPVTLYACDIDAVTDKPLPYLTAFPAWPPLAAQAKIWEEAGIGPARLRVMDRADGPKTTILGRAKDRPAATLYVGVSQQCAMIHALEVAPQARRAGLARNLTRAAALWGREQGAKWLTLVTTDENEASNALYTSLGMQVVGHYHYRIKPEA